MEIDPCATPIRTSDGADVFDGELVLSLVRSIPDLRGSEDGDASKHDILLAADEAAETAGRGVVGAGQFDMTTNSTLTRTLMPSILSSSRLLAATTGLSEQHVATRFTAEEATSTTQNVIQNTTTRNNTTTTTTTTTTPTTTTITANTTATLESAGPIPVLLQQTKLYHQELRTILSAPPRTNTVTTTSSRTNMERSTSPTSPSSARRHAELLAQSLATLSINSSNPPTSSNLEVPTLNLPSNSSFPTSPYLSSAFSDYGSSNCSSTAYTPDSETDSFDFNDATYTQHLGLTDANSPPPPPPDNYNLFAAAIQMNSLSYSFVLPTFPPQRLVERRPRFGSPEQQQTSNDPFAASFALADATDPMANTLAARRRNTDTPDDKPRVFPVLKRINTDNANSGRVPDSPGTAGTLRAPPTPPNQTHPMGQEKTMNSEMSPPTTPDDMAHIPRSLQEYYYEELEPPQAKWDCALPSSATIDVVTGFF